MARAPGSTDTCSCGAPLVFLTSQKSGKTIPVEVKASTVYVMDPDGVHCDLVQAHVTRDGVSYPTGTHLNHFQTCPDRERFRRKG